MDLGLFLPNASRGFMVSTTAPAYDPSFDKIVKIVEQAEAAGLDFCLSMVKLHGFGGPSRYWDSCLDSFTLIAGLLARTRRIKLFASSPILAMAPAMAARAAATMDSIAPGRFGINIVTGWQKAEYDTMDMWPGEAHFQRRYDYATEYVQVMKELWATGRTSFDGEFFHMRDCEVFPDPRRRSNWSARARAIPGCALPVRRATIFFLPWSA
jgi:pyrimidine oxygenase